MTMLERVAGAICQAGFIAPPCNPVCPPCMRRARAAIEAMREPTEEMVGIGAYAGEMYGNTDAEATWKAMIDVALRTP